MTDRYLLLETEAGTVLAGFEEQAQADELMRFMCSRNRERRYSIVDSDLI